MKHFFILMFSLIGTTTLATEDPSEVLKKTDQLRNPAETYTMEVSVQSPDKPEFRFEINIGGKEKSLIRTLSPRREVGKNFLMHDADMWAYLPNLKRSVRVSLNQKLTGQASNGDISRMRWFGDYTPEIESQTETEWTLLLKATRERLTYDQIRVVINKTTYQPKTAEYLTTQGKVLKRAYFEEFTEMAGGLRPSRIRIVNELNHEDYSILRILKMEQKELPASMFSKQKLKS